MWGGRDEGVFVQDGEEFEEETTYYFVVYAVLEEEGVCGALEGAEGLEDGLEDCATELEEVKVWEVGS